MASGVKLGAMPAEAPGFDLGAAFDALDVGVIVLDADGRIVAWNDWIVRVTAYSRSSALGKKLFELFPRLRATRLPTVINDALQVGSASVLTHSLNKLLPLHGENGQPLLHNIVVRPVLSGRSTYCLLQVDDVTVSVSRERVLRERQNARYHAIVDSAPDAIITTSLDRTIQWMNGTAERVFGYPQAELLGQKIDMLLAPDSEAARAFGHDGAGFADSAGPLQVVGRSKDARLANFDVSFGQWAADDRLFITSIWRDVTERMAAEAAIRRSNEELESRVAERTREREQALNQLHESQKMEIIGQLTGGVAHDFNNLLAVILGSLTLLKKAIPDDPRTSRLLEGAIQGAERGATLTKRLLAFARRQELKLVAVEVQKLVPDMLDFLRQSIGHSIEVVIDIPADVAPVKVDANQLELALMNLAVNARDAMPKGGTLTIACRNEANGNSTLPPSLPRGEYVRVSVTDSGTGMSDATLSKAMEPFFTTKGIGKGTGLGLSMVQGLTAQCGGAMQITTQIGKGTVVTLWLPRASADDFAKAAVQQVAPASERAIDALRILLVDDDSLVIMNTANMLVDLGHSVVEVSSAAHALQVLESEAVFDVVLTDYAMPGMNGLDLAAKIRQLRPGLPIILASGYADVPSQVAIAFPRLAKPYAQEDLANLLEKVVRGQT